MRIYVIILTSILWRHHNDRKLSDNAVTLATDSSNAHRSGRFFYLSHGDCSSDVFWRPSDRTCRHEKAAMTAIMMGRHDRVCLVGCILLVAKSIEAYRRQSVFEDGHALSIFVRLQPFCSIQRSWRWEVERKTHFASLFFCWIGCVQVMRFCWRCALYAFLSQIEVFGFAKVDLDQLKAEESARTQFRFVLVFLTCSVFVELKPLECWTFYCRCKIFVSFEFFEIVKPPDIESYKEHHAMSSLIAAIRKVNVFF